MLFWLTFERSCPIQESSSPLQNAVTVPSCPFPFSFKRYLMFNYCEIVRSYTMVEESDGDHA